MTLRRCQRAQATLSFEPLGTDISDLFIRGFDLAQIVLDLLLLLHLLRLALLEHPCHLIRLLLSLFRGFSELFDRLLQHLHSVFELAF